MGTPGWIANTNRHRWELEEYATEPARRANRPKKRRSASGSILCYALRRILTVTFSVRYNVHYLCEVFYEET